MNQSPRERLKKRFEEQREPIRRPPRMIILTINVTVDGKSRSRPPVSDHHDILRQAGLTLNEVIGKVGKPGYLEVALIPGSTSAAKALREGHKQVNDRITITSVRERGSNRVVMIKWQEIPFDVLDETLIQYTELFGKVEKVGRSLKWETVKEEDDPTSEMVGKWSGDRSVPVTLNRDIAHIPTWHYVGGSRLKLQVPGRRNCPRCLKSAGECRGGGEWRKCETSKAAVGNWKEEQEKFLEHLGWGERKQKILEGLEQREAVESMVGEEEEAETKALKEQPEREEEEKEGLVTELDAGKVCSGIILRNFPAPDITKDHRREKNEALYMVIVASNLHESEEKRLGEAEVAVTRRERGGKQVLDVKITLEGGDALLRKVWRQLERACKQDNVKRYQIEASTPMTPHKVKEPTEFQKARQQVKEVLKKEEARISKEKVLTKMKKTEVNKRKEEAKRRVVETKGQERRVPWDCHDVSFWLRESATSKSQCSAKNVVEVNLLTSVVEEVGAEQEEQTYSTDEDDCEVVVEEENQGTTANSRVRTPVWKAPEGLRRCGLGCTGCDAKCAGLKLPECWGCWSNKVEGEKTGKKVTKKICFNRGPCLDIRQKKQQKPSKGENDTTGNREQNSRSRSNIKASKIQRRTSLSVGKSKDSLSQRASKSPVSREVVGSQLVVLKPGLVAHIGSALEESEKINSREDQQKKREREESGNTPDKEQEKPALKAPKTSGKSKIAQPVVREAPVAEGKKPSVTGL